jgi:predicted ATPase
MLLKLEQKATSIIHRWKKKEKIKIKKQKSAWKQFYAFFFEFSAKLVSKKGYSFSRHEPKEIKHSFVRVWGYNW